MPLAAISSIATTGPAAKLCAWSGLYVPFCLAAKNQQASSVLSWHMRRLLQA
jgi:hypothetical protein